MCPAPPPAARAPQAVQDCPAHISQAATVCPEAGALGHLGLGGISEPHLYTWQMNQSGPTCLSSALLTQLQPASA